MSTQKPLGHQDETPLIQIWVMKLGDALQENLKFVVLIALLVGGGYATFVIMQSRAYEESASAWSKFASAQTAADYGDVAKDVGSSEVGLWARLAEGEAELNEGVRLQFTNRKSADAELKKAGEAFDAVIKTGNAPAAALERAYLGKARFLEATSDGKLEQAIEAYQAFAQKYPNSIYKQLVENRTKALMKPESKDFYAWFSKLNPKPEDRPNPRDGLPPGHPEINAPIMLPPIPEELYPANWTELTDGTDETKPEAEKSEKPDAAKPATKDEKAPAREEADKTPAKEAEKTDAADAKKADDKAPAKPAEDKKAEDTKSEAPAK